jgi:N-acetyltransferase
VTEPVTPGLSSRVYRGGVPDEPFSPPLRLVGRHVELVPLEESHFASLVPGLLDRSTVAFLRAPPEPTREAATAWLERWAEIGRIGPDIPFATVLRATGKAVGITSFLRLDRAARGVEIGGTWIHRDYWRTAVNTEAKWLMLHYAFDEAGMHRVQFQTDLRNVRSQRAIEGLGATPEARLREDVLLLDGSFRTSVYYSILDREWPRVRAHLEDRLRRPWSPAAAPAPTSPAPSDRAPPAVVRPPTLPPLEFRHPVTLRGRYVTLTPLRRELLPELTEAGSDPAIWTLLRIRHGDTPEGMAGLVDDLLGLQEQGVVLPFAVQWTESGRVVGIARYLDIDRVNRWVEVGTWLHPSVWRSPANTDLKLLLFTHAFDVEGVHRVQLKTDSRNARSRKAIERLGAVDEGERRDHYRFPDGTYRTSRYYSVLASEWPTVRARLQELVRRPWTGPTVPPGPNRPGDA